MVGKEWVYLVLSQLTSGLWLFFQHAVPSAHFSIHVLEPLQVTFHDCPQTLVLSIFRMMLLNITRVN